jgi:hypothetical protein
MHLTDFRSEEEYHSAVTTTIDEARKLIESGSNFVCDMDGVKLFSKRKLKNCIICPKAVQFG